MKIFVRPARDVDAENFTKWFSTMTSFDPEVLRYPDTYTLCAFVKGKILGYGIVNFGYGIQILSRFVLNPECTPIEQAAASKRILEHVITLGYINDLSKLYFVGDHSGTNRIAEHVFRKLEPEEYKDVFDKPKFPVYGLSLTELE